MFCAHLATKVALDLQVAVDVLAQPDDLFFGEVADAGVRVDAGLAENLLAGRETDAIDVGQADLNALLARKVDACDTGQARASLLALALLVARVLADHENPAVAPDDLALVAHFLDRRSYLHRSFPFGASIVLYLHAQPQAHVCRYWSAAHGTGSVHCSPSRRGATCSGR